MTIHSLKIAYPNVFGALALQTGRSKACGRGLARSKCSTRWWCQSLLRWRI